MGAFFEGLAEKIRGAILFDRESDEREAREDGNGMGGRPFDESSDSMFAQDYQEEQMRLFARRATVHFALLLLAWTLAFWGIAWVLDETVVRKVGLAVRDATVSVEHVSQEELFQSYMDQNEFSHVRDQATDNILANWVLALAKQSSGQASSEQEDGRSEDSTVVSPAVRNLVAAAQEEMGEGRDPDVRGMVERLRVEDWAAYDAALESCDRYGPETVIEVYPARTWTAHMTLYADGTAEIEHTELFELLCALKLPVALVAYAAGIVFLFARVNRRYADYFGSLFAAMDALLRWREVPDLPRDLRPTELALRDVQRDMQDADRAARAAEKRKDELVASIAHDVRTPLAAMSGYLSVLEDEPDLPEGQQRKFARAALARAESMERMLDELFEIARYNLRGIPIERSAMDVRLFCEQAAEELALAAEARGISIAVSAPAVTVRADAEKLARAVGNLLKNAVSYADEGTDVLLTARIEADDASAHGVFERTARNLTVTVENHGREIAPERIETLFERFSRGDGSRTGEGTGLGLAIAREIAEAHGGTVDGRSFDGVTVFTLRIPV